VQRIYPSLLTLGDTDFLLPRQCDRWYRSGRPCRLRDPTKRDPQTTSRSSLRMPRNSTRSCWIVFRSCLVPLREVCPDEWPNGW